MLGALLDRYGDYLCLANLRPSKVWNAVRYLLARRKSGRLGYYPLYYMIETGNVCRLRCSFCCQGHYDLAVHSAKALLRYEDFTVLLGKIRKYALVLDLFKHGEPLLNADLARMIAAARAAGIRCRVNTALNGELSDAAVRDLARSGLDKLVCAIDGVTQEVYEKYRVKGSLALALENAGRILRARRGRRPIVIFRMLVFEWNAHQVEDARRLARDMGFDRFQADPGGNFIDGRPHVWEIDRRRWTATQWHVESILTRHDAGVPGSRSGRPCPSLFNTLVLHANGASTVCCHSSRKEWEHDSLLELSLDKVWNSQVYIATREFALGLDHDRSAVWPQCRHCCWL
ncbi:MAG: radical SAM protein [Acidobacteriota bacterium]